MAAFEWPLSKTELINSALAQTGQNLVANADDGSIEWMTCSPAYERALGAVTEAHPWEWLTDWRTLEPSPDAPSDDQFDTAYPLPSDLVHLIMVRVNDQPPVAWDFLNGQLVVNSRGGPPPPSTPTTPFPVKIKGIFSTNSDLANGTPTVVMAMERFVMAAIYRGLKKDNAEAGKMFSEGNAILANAKARHDMQKPKRGIFNSRVSMSRRVRRPWPFNSTGWGGTGSPS